MTIFQNSFTTGQVCKAVNVPNEVLQNWLKRGHVIGQRAVGDQLQAPGSGSHRRFSFYSVMQVAIMKAMTDAGFSDLPNAARAAVQFSHSGIKSWALDDGIADNEPEREPAFPFETGDTLLTISRNGAEILNCVGNEHISYLIHNAGEAFAVVHINPIFDRVVSALGYHPQELLDQAYSK